MPSEQEMETAFLRRCLRYDESERGRQLDERIAQAQQNASSLRRTRSLVHFVLVLFVAGLGYTLVFQENYPGEGLVSNGQYTTFTHLVMVLGAGLLVSLLACAGLRVVYRRELTTRREEGRRLVAKFLESRLGETHDPHRNGQRHFAHEVAASRNGTGTPTPVNGHLSPDSGAAPAAVDPDGNLTSPNHRTEN